MIVLLHYQGSSDSDVAIVDSTKMPTIGPRLTSATSINTQRLSELEERELHDLQARVTLPALVERIIDVYWE